MPLELSIAQRGLTDADARRLRTIMAMAVSGASLRERWTMQDSSNADLIIVGAESGSMSIADAQSGQQVFAMLAGEADAVPEGYLRLAWPIRLENLVALLVTVEGKLRKSGKAMANGRVDDVSGDVSSSGNDLIRLASMLRSSGGSADTVWRIDGISKHPLHVSLGEKSFYFNESLMALRQLPPNVRLGFVPVAIEELSVLVGRKPIVMLQWLIGLQTGPLGLLPWLDKSQSIRLSRYPEFQMLHHVPAHRRIAGVLARPRQGVEAIVRLSGQDTATVTGFVNAVSLCGYLVSVQGRTQRAPTGAPSAAKRSLFHSFRKALGIVTANA